jgi:uncharacterized protein YggU (UPF0235/DUF167 family)
MYVKVQVRAGDKEDSIVEVRPQYLKIRVTAKPERNLANRQVVSMVASYYKVNVERVRIISGHHHPSKMLSVGVEEEGNVT